MVRDETDADAAHGRGGRHATGAVVAAGAGRRWARYSRSERNGPGPRPLLERVWTSRAGWSLAPSGRGSLASNRSGQAARDGMDGEARQLELVESDIDVLAADLFPKAPMTNAAVNRVSVVPLFSSSLIRDDLGVGAGVELLDLALEPHRRRGGIHLG